MSGSVRGSASLVVITLLSGALARDLTVDPSGAAGAHRTIQAALDACAPGDVITVKDGTYNEEPFWRTSGTAGAWITLRAEHRHKALVRGSKGYGFLFSQHASYVIVDGLDISDPSSGTGGIDAYEGHHVIYRNLRVHDCGANGIGIGPADGVIVEDCLVFNNAWTNPGASNSGISTMGLTKMFNKASGEYGVILRRNQCWDNEDKDGGTDVGGTITDGNGIILDISDTYNEGVLVENNLCINNGGKGILSLNNNAVVIRNNTCWNNTKTANLNGFKAEIEVSGSPGAIVVNNICHARTGSYAIASTSSSGTVCRYNLYYNGGLKDIASTGNNLVNAPPLFVTAAVPGDFSLRSTSQAINAGSGAWGVPTTDITGSARVQDGTVDIGAYEYVQNTGTRNTQSPIGRHAARTCPSTERSLDILGRVQGAGDVADGRVGSAAVLRALSR